MKKAQTRLIALPPTHATVPSDILPRLLSGGAPSGSSLTRNGGNRKNGVAKIPSGNASCWAYTLADASDAR